MTAALQAVVVDDSRAMRKILRRMLDDVGFTVHEAGDGIEALNVLQQLGGVAVALVDWNMPNMDGLELVRAVRAEPAYDALRLMMVTSETEVSYMVEALQAGADEYVTKPFDAMVILDKLRLLGFGAL